MAIIFTWNKDLLIQPMRDMAQIIAMKQRYGSETEIIPHDSNHLCPIRLDHAWKQLTEEEIIEWKSTDVYPALVEEGYMELVNGKYRYKSTLKKYI